MPDMTPKTESLRFATTPAEIQRYREKLVRALKRGGPQGCMSAGMSMVAAVCEMVAATLGPFQGRKAMVGAVQESFEQIDARRGVIVTPEGKAARDASPEEIFPEGHGPLQEDAAGVMRAIIGAAQKAWPDHHFTVFVAEKSADGRLPRFNYASTGAREDMIAVLKAFITKNDDMAAVDSAMAGKPQGSA